ncbi:MAG TPA: L,D-transpeptidase family protein [Steroidobacteraceae bacterium]|nr:L,D-transpeptidase family protein [Steroidobacteraceae bacterium]
MSIVARTLAAVLLAALTFAPAGSQQAAAGDPTAAAIATELEALMSPEPAPIHGVHIALQEMLQSFYARRDFRPAWGNARNAAELRRAIADSAADGLDPADYELQLLDSLARELEGPAATNDLRAQYDILLTEALLRLGYHLSFGKVDAESFDPQWNFGRTLEHRDIAREIEEALAAEDIYGRIEALKPTHRLYVGLKKELARYRAAGRSDGPAPIPAGLALKPGATDARVPLLRARLAASGDLDAAASAPDPAVYDAAVEAALRRFQARMGLESDGVAGAGTIAELNVPLAERIRQLRVNLDRGRVLLHDLPEKFVVVNIAGYAAYVVKGQDIVWSTRVQVGKPYRKTPLFRSEINYLVFNPTWTVPPGIIARDILPAAKADPASITRKGLKVLDSRGREVNPASVDWSRYSGGHIPYTLRQDPGPNNALGRVKLMFPNPYFVYLHDTPSQALFDRAERAFSSGCVRVERALELAAVVLDDPQWNAQSIDAVIAGGKLQNVTLKHKVPVLLAYWTAWVDREGRMNFRRDLYGQDAKWAAALDAPFRVRRRPLYAEGAAPGP